MDFSHRKDSFITHRAFCDALAEESARHSSPLTSTTLNFKNEESNVMNTQTSLSNGFISRQNLAGFSHEGFHDQQKPSLSLWLNHENQQNINHHPYNSVENVSSGFCDIMQMAQTSTTPMSATALLQKAAQIGSTRSSATNNPSIFSGSFGVTSSSNSTQNHDEINNMVINQNMKQHGNFNPSTTSSAMVGNNSSGFRDFLGVSSNHPFLPQEFAKFASTISSSMMSLNQFNEG